MPKSPEKMKLMKERIFHAAMELFQQQGYENTSVEQITEKAGVSKGTFFTHFSSKDTVFFEVGYQLINSLEEIIENGLQEEKSIFQITHECVQLISGWCVENKQILKPILITCIYQTPMDGRLSHRAILRELLSHGLKIGQSRGRICSDMSAEDISAIIVGLHIKVIYDWSVNSGVWSLEQKLNNCTEILYKGIYQVKQ